MTIFRTPKELTMRFDDWFLKLQQNGWLDVDGRKVVTDLGDKVGDDARDPSSRPYRAPRTFSMRSLIAAVTITATAVRPSNRCRSA